VGRGIHVVVQRGRADRAALCRDRRACIGHFSAGDGDIVDLALPAAIAACRLGDLLQVRLSIFCSS
jgi:hypothetical protein